MSAGSSDSPTQVRRPDKRATRAWPSCLCLHDIGAIALSLTVEPSGNGAKDQIGNIKTTKGDIETNVAAPEMLG